VRLARDWVTGVLGEIGRDELAESARLAVSELVTNAILHADPPMTVHVRGTTEHPRIEVSDQSLVPPQRRGTERLVDREDDFSWTTMGRGLDLVSMHSVRWGAEITPNGLGKVVWFEPSAGAHDDPVDGEVFTLDAALVGLAAEPAHPDTLVTIKLLGMPVELFTHLRQHFNEIGREQRLLSISDGDRYPLALEFAEAYLQVEYERRQVVGLDVLDRAMADGTMSVDLSYSAPPTAPATMERLSGLINQVYDQLTDKVLLSARPPAELVALQDWYLGEFSRQAAGEAPLRWRGPFRLAPRQEVS
jgi:anti-sigma regulatory factor (Ser/Thr protein kinase)